MPLSGKTWTSVQVGVLIACKLISERCGLTAQMFGIDAIMLDALQPHKVLVERLQTQVVPIGHRVRYWITQCFRQLNSSFLSETPSYGPNFLEWKQRDDVSEELSTQVEVMARRYVYEFLKDCKFRLRPYWKLILDAETINPIGPSRLFPSEWEGVEDLCKRAQMSVRMITLTIQDLKNQREAAVEWYRSKERSCESDLFKFYHDRLQDDLGQQVQPRFPHANKFIVLIFSLHFVSASIETFFSKSR